MKIIQNTLKIEENLKCLKKIRVGPKKVGSVGFRETRHFFFFGLRLKDANGIANSEEPDQTAPLGAV